MGLIRLQNQLFICLLQDKPITSDQSIGKMDYRAINPVFKIKRMTLTIIILIYFLTFTLR